MNKHILFFITINFIFISCGINKLQLTEDILENKNQNEIYFDFQIENNEAHCIINNKKFTISNVCKVGEIDNFYYSFLKTETDISKQILLVYDKKTKKYDYCLFFPETSHFYEDDLICFVNEKNPNQYPLPELYEIRTTIIDFKKGIKKEDYYHSRNWSNYFGKKVQDFYYSKPYFFKSSFKEIPDYYLYWNDRKEKDNSVVYYVIWKQANFPIYSYYYIPDRNKFSGTCTYPNFNNPSEYRTPSQEFIPNQNQNKAIILSELYPNNIICSDMIGESEIGVILDKEDTKQYNSYYFVIKNDSVSKINLDSIFEYQDELKKIEIASGKEGKACFIITTKEFSYDMTIDLSTYDSEVYLRASSFPEKARSLE